VGSTARENSNVGPLVGVTFENVLAPEWSVAAPLRLRALSRKQADLVSGPRNRVVFPNVYDGPSQLRQLSVFSVITFAIYGDLRFPPLPVVDRKGAVLRTTVPEASNDEHGDFCSCECDVRRLWKMFWSDPESHASAEELAPHSATLGPVLTLGIFFIGSRPCGLDQVRESPSSSK
jgi:hypothetical protein